MWEYRPRHGGVEFILLPQMLCHVPVVIYVPSREPHRVTTYQEVVDLAILVCGRRNVGMRVRRFALKGSHFPICFLCFFLVSQIAGLVQREGGISSLV